MSKNRRKSLISICLSIVLMIIVLGLATGCSSKRSEKSSNSTNTVSNSENIEEITSESASETTTEQETEETTKESIAEASKTEIVMVGDVLLHTHVSDSGLMDDGTYNYDHLFKNVKSDIESADLALVNQEVILGGREIGLSGYPAFNGAYEVADSLVNSGFDVILHATNHALDRGSTGITNCINYWRTNYPEIGVLGVNLSSEEQDNVYITEKNGIKIAILNYTYGTNGISMPDGMPFAVNLIDRDKMARDVAIAEENADFTIVAIHWGIEYTHSENESQRELAEYLCELGVDVILGTHPHVIQPIEMLETTNGNKTLVYYSLGNFINATSDYGSGVADRMIGGMADFTIHKEDNGDVVIESYGVVPLVTQMLTGSGNITTYKLSEYTDELASNNGIVERDSVFTYQYCKDLVAEVFGSENIIEK